MATAPSPIARGPQWQLDDTTITRLATELARDMYTVPEILARFDLDAEVFRERVRPHPTFTRAYREAHTLWHAASNTKERVQLKAQTVFEDWLSEADRLFHDQNQPLTGKVELLKTMSKVGGLDQSDKQSAIAPGDRVLVQINLSAGDNAPQTITIDKMAPVIDMGQPPEPLPYYETAPIPVPAVYELPLPTLEPVPFNPSLPLPPLPAQVTQAKRKLVPFKSATA